MIGILERVASVPFSAVRRRRARRAPGTMAAPPAAFPAPAGTQVVQARVMGVEPDGRPRVLLFDGGLTTAVAEWAIPYRYCARVGDLLWVIGDEHAHYVLGVARGGGRSELWFAGDGALTASGALRLGADRAVRIAGRALQVRAQDLEGFAKTLQEKATSVTRTAGKVQKLIAGRVTRVTEARDSVLARKVRVIAAQLVKIDALQIKLM